MSKAGPVLTLGSLCEKGQHMSMINGNQFVLRKYGSDLSFTWNQASEKSEPFCDPNLVCVLEAEHICMYLQDLNPTYYHQSASVYLV